MSKEDVEFVERLSDVISTNRGVVGDGESWVVLDCRLQAQRVVVKSWNGLNNEGLMGLQNETTIYKRLERSHARVLGEGVPILRMSRMGPRGCCAGYGLRRERNPAVV